MFNESKVTPYVTPDDYAQWLGGIFEAGGTIGLYISEGKVLPSVLLGNQDRTFLNIIHKEFDGTVLPHMGNSFRWKTLNSDQSFPHALDVLDRIEPYCPSRQEEIAIVRECAGLKFAQQLERLEYLRQLDRVANVKIEDYADFVKRARSVAGVIDSRSTPLQTALNIPGNQMRTNSYNFVLLDALRSSFGGSVNPKPENRPAVLARGKDGHLIRGKNVWNIGKTDIRNRLLPLVSDYLLIQKAA